MKCPVCHSDMKKSITSDPAGFGNDCNVLYSCLDHSASEQLIDKNQRGGLRNEKTKVNLNELLADMQAGGKDTAAVEQLIGIIRAKREQEQK